MWSPGEVWGADSGVHGREGRTLGLVAPEDGEENNSGVQAVLLTHEVYSQQVLCRGLTEHCFCLL